MTHDKFTLANAADQLGLLKAESAMISDQADAYKAALISAAAEGAGHAFDGAMFRATVSFTNRSTTDWTAIIKTVIEASDAETKAWIASLITKHTKTAEGFPSFACRL
jgi:hypothetical protein